MFNSVSFPMPHLLGHRVVDIGSRRRYRPRALNLFPPVSHWYHPPDDVLLWDNNHQWYIPQRNMWHATRVLWEIINVVTKKKLKKKSMIWAAWILKSMYEIRNWNTIIHIRCIKIMNIAMAQPPTDWDTDTHTLWERFPSTTYVETMVLFVSRWKIFDIQNLQNHQSYQIENPWWQLFFCCWKRM